jgi:hypothetical protein
LGFIAAIILLCKINMGIYAFVAIALAVSLNLKGRVRFFALWTAITASIGLGLLAFLLVRTETEKLFVIAYLGSLITTAAFAYVRPSLHQTSLVGIKWLLFGLGMSLCFGVGITLAWGTTLSQLFHSLVIEPGRLAKSYHSELNDGTRIGRIVLPTAGIVLAICLFFHSPRFLLRPVWLGSLKVAVGAGLLVRLLFEPTHTLIGSLLFLWLLLVDAQPMKDTDYSNRLFLAILCPLFSLQVLPVAGAQIVWATFLQVIAASVLVADGIQCIQRKDLRVQAPRLIRLLAGAAGPILAIYFFFSAGRLTNSYFHQWKNSVSVNLYGTHWLRVSPAEQHLLTATDVELKNHCRRVMMIPGLYSFSVWSGVPPAETRQIDTWPFYWAKEVQRDELPKLRQENQSCVLISSDMYTFWKNMAINKGDDALLSEVRGTMTPFFEMDDITLYRASQKPDTTPEFAVAAGKH